MYKANSIVCVATSSLWLLNVKCMIIPSLKDHVSFYLLKLPANHCLIIAISVFPTLLAYADVLLSYLIFLVARICSLDFSDQNYSLCCKLVDQTGSKSVYLYMLTPGDVYKPCGRVNTREQKQTHPN